MFQLCAPLEIKTMGMETFDILRHCYSSVVTHFTPALHTNSVWVPIQPGLNLTKCLWLAVDFLAISHDCQDMSWLDSHAHNTWKRVNQYKKINNRTAQGRIDSWPKLTCTSKKQIPLQLYHIIISNLIHFICKILS